MVETAIFSIFHRAPPPQATPLVEPAPPPAAAPPQQAPVAEAVAPAGPPDADLVPPADAEVTHIPDEAAHRPDPDNVETHPAPAASPVSHVELPEPPVDHEVPADAAVPPPTMQPHPFQDACPIEPSPPAVAHPTEAATQPTHALVADEVALAEPLPEPPPASAGDVQAEPVEHVAASEPYAEPPPIPAIDALHGLPPAELQPTPPSMPDEPTPSGQADEAVSEFHGPAQLHAVALAADLLGLANPIVITLLARLDGSPSVALDASGTGIYRPRAFRPAPWTGFAYDPAEDGRTGMGAGTRILTARGELEVERLQPGDTAMTLRAPALLPITWIGRSNATEPPVLIEAGALGPDLPRRQLCLASNQAVYVDPVPVPARQLVNGTTIRTMDPADIDLFHIDVGAVEILLAEGLPLSSSARGQGPSVP